MFAKTLFRMGIPVSPKNIFPSNIQGLPTWYEVRVSEAGYLARRDGIDLMVAMNPQTYEEDLRERGAGRLAALRQHDAAHLAARRHHRARHADRRRCARRSGAIRASASCSRTWSMSAR